MTGDEAFTPGDALSRIEILYVDDDAHRRDSMRKLLMSLSPRRVQIAESASEALKVVMGTPCNLLIVEHRMRPIDGITLVRELRAAANYPRALIPALILGDPVGTDVIKEALAAGANHFLIKPATPAKLYERIQIALGETRPFVVKDGHYVLKPHKMTLPQGATKSDIAAAR